MIRGIGINAPHDTAGGRLAILERLLHRYQEIGFDTVELSASRLNFIRAGELVPAEVERARLLLEQFNFHLTLHGPDELSLIRSPMHRKVMDAVLGMAHRLGADRVVYHSAQIALHDPYHHLAGLPSEPQLNEMWAQETAYLKEYGQRAAQLGVTLCVENRDPHRWEISALGICGKPPSELSRYHQGMRLDLLARQMAEINLPSVGICLDVGHAYLAAPYWPQSDYLAGIRACAPWVKHLHISDNFGRIDDISESLHERLVFGEADSHLPPGWGDIPLGQVLAILQEAGYDGHLILEIRPRYEDYLEEAFAETRRLLEKLQSQGGRR